MAANSPSMNTTPDARTLANRKNAIKSTGPRTPQGKTRSRQNALKHGLSALQPTVLPPAMEADFQKRLQGYLHDVCPQSDIEADLTRRLALAFTRAEFAAQTDLARTADRVRLAQFLADPITPREYGDSLQNLADDPDNAQAELENLLARPAGCRRLAQFWREIRTQLATQKSIDIHQCAILYTLCDHEDQLAAQLNCDLNLDLCRYLIPVAYFPTLQPPDQSAAHGHSRRDARTEQRIREEYANAPELIADAQPDERAPLLELLDTCCETSEIFCERHATQLELEDPSLAPTALARALAPTSPEDLIPSRYETQFSHEIQRTLKQLMNLRKHPLMITPDDVDDDDEPANLLPDPRGADIPVCLQPPPDAQAPASSNQQSSEKPSHTTPTPTPVPTQEPPLPNEPIPDLKSNQQLTSSTIQTHPAHPTPNPSNLPTTLNPAPNTPQNTPFHPRN